jgi:hypothetical protein
MAVKPAIKIIFSTTVGASRALPLTGGYGFNELKPRDDAKVMSDSTGALAAF